MKGLLKHVKVIKINDDLKLYYLIFISLCKIIHFHLAVKHQELLFIENIKYKNVSLNKFK